MFKFYNFNIFKIYILHQYYKRQHQQKSLYISHAHKGASVAFFFIIYCNILILRARRKSLKVFNRGYANQFFLFWPADLFLFTLLSLHILYDDYSVYFNESQTETQQRKRSDVTKTSIKDIPYPLKLSHACKDQRHQNYQVVTDPLRVKTLESQIEYGLLPYTRQFTCQI